MASSNGTAKRPVATFDHLKKKKRQELVRYVPIDGGEALEKFEEARMDLERARLVGDPARVATALEAVEDARVAAQSPDASVRCVFVALGRTRYREIQSAHPPVAAEVEKAKENKEEPPDFNPETMLPVLIAATMTEPKLTEDEVRALTLPEGETTEGGVPGQGWTEAELNELWAAALMVNNSSRITDFSF